MNQNPIDSLAGGVETLSEKCCVCLEDCEEQIREQPWASVLIAAAIGYLLHLLPIGKILTRLVGALLFLVKPALIVLGVLNLVSVVSERRSASE
jgi:hypothetical protein